MKYIFVFLGLLFAYTLFYAGISKLTTGLTVNENINLGGQNFG